MEKELQFPVIYDLRVIYSGNGEEGIKKISTLLNDLGINYSPGFVKPGGKGSLSRLGINITVISKEQMDTMYKNLQVIPDIKWAT